MRSRVSANTRKELYVEALVQVHRTGSAFSYLLGQKSVDIKCAEAVSEALSKDPIAFISLNQLGAGLTLVAGALRRDAVAFRFAEYTVDERRDASGGTATAIAAVRRSGWTYPEAIAMGVEEARKHEAVKDKAKLERLVSQGVTIMTFGEGERGQKARIAFNDYVVVARNGDLFRFTLGNDRLM